MLLKHATDFLINSSTDINGTKAGLFPASTSVSQGFNTSYPKLVRRCNCSCSNTIASNYQPSALAYNFSKGNHFRIEVIGVMDESGNKNYDIKELLKNGDFLTIGLYKGILPSSEGQLNETELIYEDPSMYNFDEDGFYKIEKPEFVSLEFDAQEYQYVLT
ncbi:MAG TPA: hypothetical protein PK734_07050 [Bacteroidales bacterium]|nr:hypothetical protein [Bacteroidales bacterium]